MQTWETLFNHAMDCLDTIPRSVPEPPWTLGGGTVLMLHYAHRQSQDIDIFLGDPQYLGFLSPRLNDRIEDWVSDWDEGPGWLKLAFPLGEVDFIVAPPLTASPPDFRVIQGRTAALDTPAEIVAKKLHHRAASFQPRDVFDLAVVQSHEAGALWASRDTWSADLPTLRRRMRALETQYPTQATALNLLPAGEPYRNAAWAIAHAFIEDVYRDIQHRDEELEP